VAEAVCFGVPDEKYGEVVAAAVVLRPGVAAKSEAEVERSVKELCAAKLSAFKVRLFGEITSFETLLEQGIFTPKKKGFIHNDKSLPPCNASRSFLYL